MMGPQQITFAVADERCMIPREVAHQGNVCMTIGPGATQDNLIVQAHQVTSDRIDPQEEAALGPGRVNTCQRSRLHGDAR